MRIKENIKIEYQLVTTETTIGTFTTKIYGDVTDDTIYKSIKKQFLAKTNEIRWTPSEKTIYVTWLDKTNHTYVAYDIKVTPEVYNLIMPHYDKCQNYYSHHAHHRLSKNLIKPFVKMLFSTIWRVI